MVPDIISSPVASHSYNFLNNYIYVSSSRHWSLSFWVPGFSYWLLLFVRDWSLDNFLLHFFFHFNWLLSWNCVIQLEFDAKPLYDCRICALSLTCPVQNSWLWLSPTSGRQIFTTVAYICCFCLKRNFLSLMIPGAYIAADYLLRSFKKRTRPAKKYRQFGYPLKFDIPACPDYNFSVFPRYHTRPIESTYCSCV